MKKIPRFIAPLEFTEALAALLGRRKTPGDSRSPFREFAERFAAYIGAAYAVPAPSARIALVALLKSLDLKPGGEIILPALTFHSIPAVFVECGFHPRFVDIDPDRYLIDPALIEEAITDQTTAIVPTHLYGRACDMEAISAIARKHNLIVIEDCAQGCGAAIDGRQVGSFGDAAFFSFGPTKNLSTLWSGMIVTDSVEVAQKTSAWLQTMPLIGRAALARRLVFALGMRLVTRPLVWNLLMAPALSIFNRLGIDPIERMTAENIGAKVLTDAEPQRMPRDFQGLIGLSQLGKLDHSNQKRSQNGNRLLELLNQTPGIELPAPAKAGENIFMSFPVRVKDRRNFRQRLLKLGVDTTTGYMSVGPQLPGLENTGQAPRAAEVIAGQVHLPVFPDLSDRDIDRLAQAVKQALAL